MYVHVVCLVNLTFLCLLAAATTTRYLKKGSDYRYTWPGAIQIKGSVCHSNGMDLLA